MTETTATDHTKRLVPLTELQTRMSRLRSRMDATHPEWECIAIFSKINQYYFTGTMQEGVLLIPRNGEATFWVRRSYERALAESVFPIIKPMESFRDAAAAYQKLPSTVYLEAEVVPLAVYQRFQKHFPFATVRSVDKQMGAVRSIKSPYELALMEEAGAIHQRVLEEWVPKILRVGMSEAELGAELFSKMIGEGFHGVSRFSMFGAEMVVGYIGFGENSLYPSSIDGPGGYPGLGPAVPILGSRERKLKEGDLVFLDTGSGVEGYHTDKTVTYMFGKTLPAEVISAHERCVDIQLEVASQLKPGAIPSEIYKTTMAGLSPEFCENFMGFGNRRAKFLGHGIGLLVDELPVIAEGFDEPLEPGMALAIEPKKGIKGVGMVGIENTFFVTPQGGRSITGVNRGLIKVGA